MKLNSILFTLALAVPALPQALKIETAANPAGPGSLQANLSLTRDGNALLSWTETGKDDTYMLRYSVRRGGQWSAPKTIAANRKVFRHPAELPAVVTLNDGTLMAHWVENPKEESEAEYLYVSSSRDGDHWTTPALAHADKSLQQHGLASMIATGTREASMFWLEALQGEEGPVTLKRSIISGDGKLMKEESLDKDVCTCCPTAVAKTTRGLLLAYRDHAPGDIRDIAVMRLENGRWSASSIIYPDKWKINACPTNAATVSTRGDRAAIAWYTGAQDNARTQLVFSTDGGTTFGKPILVSTGHSFGYASVALEEAGGATVSWLEQVQSGVGTRLLVRQVSPAGVAGPVLQIAQGSRPNLGYARLLEAGNETWIAWGGEGSKLQTARLTK